MGELFVELKLPNGKRAEIPCLKRRLEKYIDAEHDEDKISESLSIKDVIKRKQGGIILGEGDSGKSTFVKMIADAAATYRPTKLIRLARDGMSAKQIYRAAHELCISDEEKAIKHGLLILDGLDEREEIVQSIIALSEASSNCTIWVTSRPCNAAMLLQSCEDFKTSYRLSELLPDDVESMAKSIGLDAGDFMRKISAAGLESFLSKPGGVIVLLRKYLKNKISKDGCVAAMEETLRDFAAKTRDGKMALRNSESNDISELVEATRWMGVILFLSNKSSLWIGEPDCGPPSALPFDSLPFDKFSRKVCSIALERRLFEPLTVDNLRPTYADMLPYLAGSWLAKTQSNEFIQKTIPMEGGYISECCKDVLSWIAQINPKLALPWIEKDPGRFLKCREAIKLIEPKRFVDLCLRSRRILANRISVHRVYVTEKVHALDGYDSLLNYCLSLILSLSLSSEDVELWFTVDSILCEYKDGYPKALDAFLNRTDFGKVGTASAFRAIQHLVHFVAASFREKQEIPTTVKNRLLDFLRDEHKSGSMNYRKATIVRMLYPEYITLEEIRKFLIKPFTLPVNEPRLYHLLRVLGEAGIDWYKKQIPDKIDPQHQSLDRIHITDYYIRALCQVAKEDAARAIKSICCYKSKYEHGEFYKIFDTLGPDFTIDVLKALLAEEIKNHKRTELSLACSRYLDRYCDETIYRRIRDELVPLCHNTDTGLNIAFLLNKYLNKINRPNFSIPEIIALTKTTNADDEPKVLTEEAARKIAAEQTAEIKAENAKSRKKLEDKIKKPRPELTQEMVAKDFGVSRKTINEWETEQTVDGPDNKSNKFGYYKSLRTNPDLRNAYNELVQIVQMYKNAAKEAKAKGRRSITFVAFNEKYHSLKSQSLNPPQV